MTSEAFGEDVRERAYKAKIKLHPDQLEYLQTLLYSQNSLAVEEAYHKLTGHLLEPVVARYWISCKKIPLGFIRMDTTYTHHD